MDDSHPLTPDMAENGEPNPSVSDPLPDLEYTSVPAHTPRLINWGWFYWRRRGLGSCVASCVWHVLLIVLLVIFRVAFVQRSPGLTLSGKLHFPTEIVLPPLQVAPPEEPAPAEQVVVTLKPAPDESVVEPAPAPDERKNAPSPAPDVAMAKPALAPKPQEAAAVERPQAVADDDPKVTQPPTEVADAAGENDAFVSSAAQRSDGAMFFGVKSLGDRFVFCVDSSVSMRGARWKQATGELVFAIERLSESQSFYVIFFDAQVHPMFGADQIAPVPLPATAENVNRLRQWMDTVKLGYETNPLPAIQLALSLQPDAIFLLSDGEFTSDTLAYLRKYRVHAAGDEHERVPASPVHAIALHTHKGEAMLQAIANESGGKYQFIPELRPKLREFVKQRAAAKALEGLGAKLDRDVFGNITRVDWAGATGGFEHLADLPYVQQILLLESKIRDVDLEHLGKLRSLQVLVLSQTAVSDEGLRHLSDATQLFGLFLDGTQVTDKGMQHIAGLINLHVLSTPGTLSDSGVASLRPLTNLETLYLVEPHVTDQGLTCLRDATRLKRLNLASSAITDDGLKNVTSLVDLEVLHLNGTPISGEGLRHLRGLARLRELDVSHTRLNDAGLQPIGRLSGLASLHLDDTQISDAGLVHLAKLRHLQDVTFSNTRVSESAQREFSARIIGPE